MDITRSISHLLYHHDCVIVPGFGGFLCNYKPADIHPVLHTIKPPAKAISFNINLRLNDGLLANYIAQTKGINYHEALNEIEQWATASISILNSEKELNLAQIGRLMQDVEGGWQFEPDERINYLPSSFGLPVITAAPVLRGREMSFAGQEIKPALPTIKRWGQWKIAATIALFAGIAFLSTLMFTGHVIEPLTLNEAGVMSALMHITGTAGPVIKLIAPAASGLAVTKDDKRDTAQITANNILATVAPVVDQNKTEVSSTGSSYYIIVGVFASRYNLEKARKSILSNNPGSSLYEETSNGLTRIGYLVGKDVKKAQAELVVAKSVDPAYWLLQK